MNPTPRQFYRRNHKEEAGQLEMVLNEAWFQRAIVAAQAEMANSGADADALGGVKRFIAALHSLCEDDKPAEQLPDHSELKTYG